MNDTIPDTIDLDDETLDFSDVTPISDSEDVPEMRVPVLDDFIILTPIFGKFLGDSIVNNFNALGFMLFQILFVPSAFHTATVPNARQIQKMKRDFINAQVKAMAPHIVRFQRMHLWEENEWGQKIRNKHTLTRYRNVERHWKMVNS